jgi:glycine/D-amino acid oxidase-like deaminating enzyme
MHIVVVGAGILGASTAFHAARAGARVTVVDAAHEGRSDGRWGRDHLSVGIRC